MAASRPQENKPLTALRGICAMYVVVHHIGLIAVVVMAGQVDLGSPAPLITLLVPGFTAVDAFFVLSGFILTAVYADLQPDGVAGFLLKRVFRIYPLHLTVLAMLVVRAGWTHEAVPWADLPAVAGLLHIWTLGEPSWSPQSWSTAVELICYLLFPAALWALQRVRRMRGLLSDAVLVLLLCLAEQWVQEHYLGSALGWHSVVRGGVSFALGMALSRLASALPSAGPRLCTLGEVGTVAALGWCVLGHHLPAMALGWAGLIFWLSFDRGLVARLLHARVLVWLGHISFSIYLLHMFILDDFLLWVPPAHLFSLTPTGMVLWGAAQVIVLLGLSTLTWRLVEEPGRRVPGRLGLGRAGRPSEVAASP